MDMQNSPVRAESRAPFDLGDALERNLTRQIMAGQTADKKFAMLVPTATAMIAVLAALFRYATPSEAALIMMQITIAPLLGMFVVTGMTVFPRYKTGGSSLLFFGAITKQDRADYVELIKTMGEEEYLADLGEQIHVTAGIAARKHRLARVAYTLFLAALPIWAAAIYLHANQA